MATTTDWQSLEYWKCGKWLLIHVSQQQVGALTANLCSGQHDCLNSINWEDQRQNSKSDLFPDRLERLHGEKALMSGRKEWTVVLTAGELAERVSSHFMKLNSPSPALRTGVSPLFKSIHNNIFSSSLHPWRAEKDSRSLYDLECFSPNTNDPQILLEFVSYHPLRAVGIIGAVAKDLLIL